MSKTPKQKLTEAQKKVKGLTLFSSFQTDPHNPDISYWRAAPYRPLKIIRRRRITRTRRITDTIEEVEEVKQAGGGRQALPKDPFDPKLPPGPNQLFWKIWFWDRLPLGCRYSTLTMAKKMGWALRTTERRIAYLKKVVFIRRRKLGEYRTCLTTIPLKIKRSIHRAKNKAITPPPVAGHYTATSGGQDNVYRTNKREIHNKEKTGNGNRERKKDYSRTSANPLYREWVLGHKKGDFGKFVDNY